MMQATNYLKGAVDTHVHSSPDVVDRRQDDLEVAQAAAEAGMAAIVLKSHHFATADRAVLAGKRVPGIRVLGGLALNASPCGGLNPHAVHAALSVGGKVIWMPTVSAVNHQAYVDRTSTTPHVRAITGNSPAVPVVDSRGKVLSDLEHIMELIAEADAVLATGHLSVKEITTVVLRAKELGVQRILVTHPEAEVINMDLGTQSDLASLGVMFERCYFSVLGGLAPQKVLEAIASVGVASTVLATDLGQQFNPPPSQGMHDYCSALLNAGLADEDWRAMTATNPGQLLDL
jgi:hypothetical protein